MAHAPHARPAGSMTAAMNARHAPSLPRVLRVGVIQGGAITEERIVRERRVVTAGTTERSTLAVRAEGFPDHVELFTVAEGAWALSLVEGMEGRVAVASGTRSLEECVREGLTRAVGSGRVLPLTESSRGKVTLRGVTFLFQFVPAPPVAPRPQLPASLRNSLARSVDWRYNACLAGFLAAAVSGLGWVEYGYDPVVEDPASVLDQLQRFVRVDPALTPDEPEAPPVTEGAAVASNTPSSTRDPAPNRGGPHGDQRRGTRGSHGDPRGPNAGTVTRATQAADLAAATVQRELSASFAALTANGPGSRSAVDLLHHNVLLDGTAQDLARTTGITTATPGIARPTVTASNATVRGDNRLGRPTVVTCEHCPPGAMTGTVRDPEPVRLRVIVRPEPDPEPTTCGEDAGAVSRAMRRELGGMRSCYERGVRNNPTLAGRVELSFTLGTTGRATDVSAHGLTPEVDACLANAVRRIVFPIPSCGAADFRFPITFRPGEH